jgi:hypothetical protein
MTRTCSLDDVCVQLFADYPLAAWPASPTGARRSMILLLQEHGDSQFFVLTQDRGESPPRHSVGAWPGRDAAVLGTGLAADSGGPVRALTLGVPIPRHGSLFGWVSGNVISALVPIYATYTLASPRPSWSLMPLAGSPETCWPPIARQRSFGSWFWQYYHAGNLISLADLIAEYPGTIFWAETRATLSSDCCAVTHDISSPGGPVLRQGCYMHQDALRSGMPVPALETLLAGPGLTDLSPRFRWFTTGTGDG